MSLQPTWFTKRKPKESRNSRWEGDTLRSRRCKRTQTSESLRPAELSSAATQFEEQRGESRAGRTGDRAVFRFSAIKPCSIAAGRRLQPIC
jgi:hypothetical protein